MGSNTEYWDKFCRPPEGALKAITGGRLSGMTDINPQWRLRAMTETFGPCGVGWKYQIHRLWTEAGRDEVVLAFAEVSICIKVDGNWSDPIPGIGGNKLIEKERNGYHNNDEGYKMAVTDALSVAMKALGVGADIYAGLWDGREYIKDKEPEVFEYSENIQSWLDKISQAACLEKLEELEVNLVKEDADVKNTVRPFYLEKRKILRQQPR